MLGACARVTVVFLLCVCVCAYLSVNFYMPHIYTES